MKRIVIVGGGVAGLAAGIYGQMAGFDCRIFERCAAAGGNLTGWERSGFHVDNCIHWLTGTAPGTALRAMWEELGGLLPDTGLCETERLYGSELGGKSVSLWRDLARTREEMLRLSPEDRDEIERFIGAVKVCAAAAGPGRLSAGDAARFAAAMARYGSMDLYGLARRFRHPLLRLAMTDYIGGEFLAAGLVLAYAAYESGNGGIPRGGSRRMAERMAEKFSAVGGTLVTGEEAACVRMEGGRAAGLLLRSGEAVPADYVICACDPGVTFGRLLDRRLMPAGLRRCYADPAGHPVFSSFHAAFAADGIPAGIRNTTVFPVEPLAVGSETVGRMAVREYSHEPSFAPPGRTVIQCLVFQRAADCDRWQRLSAEREAYEQAKTGIAEDMRRRIEARCPELRGRLTLLDAWTPATYHRYFGAYKGAYMCFAMTRGGQRRRTAGPRIRGAENVLLATQWQKLPGGLPTAAQAGREAAQTVAALERAAAPRVSFAR